MKKVTIVMALLGTLLMNDTVAAGTSFKDTSDHWANQTIAGAVMKGYVNGYEDGTFRPENNVTRAEFITLITRALGIPQVSSPADVEWYDVYLNSARDVGIFHEKDMKSFDITQSISRLEMAKIAARVINQDLQQKEELSNGEAMVQTTQKGIIHGLNGGDLSLDGLTTRAQAVTVIERILTVLSGTELQYDQEAVNNAKRL